MLLKPPCSGQAGKADQRAGTQLRRPSPAFVSTGVNPCTLSPPSFLLWMTALYERAPALTGRALAGGEAAHAAK